MLIFWGQELITFYNDAFRPSLGNNGKHPSSLGQPGEVSWAESWPVIGPMIYNIMAGGEAVWFEDQKLPLYRDGRMGYAYWTYSFSPVVDDTGAVNGVLVTCSETTGAVENLQRLGDSEQRFQHLIRRATVGIIVLIGEEMRISIVNDAYGKLIGRTYDELIGKNLFEVIPEAEAYFRPLAEGVRQSGAPLYLYSTPYAVEVNDTVKEGYLDLVYQPFQEADGTATGVMVLCQDVTEQVVSRKKIEENEFRFRSLIEEAPVATCLFVGPEMRVEIINSMMVAAWGKDFSVRNKPLIEALPELVNQPFLDILADVYTSGVAYEAKAARVDLVVGGVLGTYYYDFTYKPLRNEHGQVWAIINVSVNVTDRVLATRKLAASETNLRAIISSAPAAISLLVGRDLVIENPNQPFIDLIGEGAAIAGLPLHEVVGNLPSKESSFLTTKAIDEVFISGTPSQLSGAEVKTVLEGVATYRYYNVTYTPVFNTEEQVYAILYIAIDVTEQMLAQQALVDVEVELRNAIELAELGTWMIDVATQQIVLSPRQADWLGLEGPNHSVSAVLDCIIEEDRERVEKALFSTILPAADPNFNEEFTVVNAREGQYLILHAVGQAYIDTNGLPVRIAGTTQDITGQRDLVLALANQVQRRTEELALTNEELAATIEELAATNEELTATNEEITTSNEEYITLNDELQITIGLLNRSNDNLQRFAYVASHDLQEPLRKIQQFGNLLKLEHSAALGDELVYLDRMQVAAERMSTLIHDLLSYSRISAQSEVREAVSLNHIIEQVMTDLELIIQETKAQIKIGALPTIIGDASQLGQLFQNLLSNALKFHRPGVSPIVDVSAHIIAYTDLPEHIKPIKATQLYHQIEVSDNGIGFEPQYAERIFEVFQRLHRKHEYAGTGIGLSISERVVTNHGGAISATGQLGQGATFTIYLPV
ncbi:PAS domain-containing sensor histidine kinase [Fibrella arboris]|uniref:PAS domain-containing sensor histidine kinase n=1 Tax=Fibrella arboris TaxID=3242486 RepID=UPI00352121AB